MGWPGISLYKYFSHTLKLASIFHSSLPHQLFSIYITSITSIVSQKIYTVSDTSQSVVKHLPKRRIPVSTLKMGMSKTMAAAKKGAMESWTKFVRPTVSRGKTAWPKSSKDLEKYGVRFDYDGVVVRNGMTYHKYQLQPNAGKVPTSIKKWMQQNGSTTHAVMADVLIKDGASEGEVDEALVDAFTQVRS